MRIFDFGLTILELASWEKNGDMKI